jgi:hypothetical protein
MNKITALAVMGMGFLCAGMFLASIDWFFSGAVCVFVAFVCTGCIAESK